MKNLFLLALFLIICFAPFKQATAQCTPDTVNCIDIGNPGEMCPGELVDGEVNVPYNEVVTIIPPDYYDYNGTPIYLSHIRIVSVTNIPPGLDFVTNASNDLFAVGSHYCILISGTPTAAGTYDLAVEAEPWVLNAPLPLTVTDDTTLSIVIHPYMDVEAQTPNRGFTIGAVTPNPFGSNAEISFFTPRDGLLSLVVFDELGREIQAENKYQHQGDHSILIEGDKLLPGVYFFTLQFDGEIKNGLLMKQ